MSKSRITIERIAREVGLSKFSVSRALAGKGGVGEAARARIRRVAAELGYRPPPLPAGAGRPSSRQVLFVMQDQDPVSSELWINMLHGAEREGLRRDLALTARHAGQFATMTEPEPGMVGIILAVNRPDPLLECALRLGLPLVCAGYADPRTPVDQVVGNDWAGGVAVGRYLTGLGHRRIAFVRGEAGLAGRGERMRGLRDGTEPVAGVELQEIGFAEPGGFREAFLELAASGGAPSALFCAHDGMAITVISELLRLGIGVPDEISVVGFNDFICATQIAPALTTVRLPQEQIGAMMLRCLAMRLDDGAHLPRLKIMLAPELVERASTAPPAKPNAPNRLRSPRVAARPKSPAA